MRAYREILTIPGAWKFSAAGLLARSGGAMMGIGIVLMVSAVYGSYGLAGLLSAASAISWATGTAVLANLVDRFGQRRVMYPAVLISVSGLAVLVVLAVLHVPAWMLFAPTIVSAGTAGAPGALVRARWNHVIGDADRLHTAYSLESTLDELTFVVGPVLATALSTGLHPAAGLVAPIVLALAGAHLLYGQRSTEPPLVPQPARAPRESAFGRLILLVPGVAAVVAVNLFIGCMFGSIDVSVVAAATEWDERPAAGVVLAAFSIASAASGFAYGARKWASPLATRFYLGVIALFASGVVLLSAHSLISLAAVGMLVGITVSPTLINASTLLQRLAPPDRLTEALSWLGTALGIGVAVGSSVSGQVIDRVGHQGGLITVAVFGACAAAVALLGRRVLTRASSGASAP